MRGMGAQYVVDVRDRVKPEIAVLFYKPASSLCGPEDDIVIPESARGENNDYEVELSVVIGRDAKNVRVEDALDYVLGYSTSNDVSFANLLGRRGADACFTQVSSRGLCVKGLQWGIGKSYDSAFDPASQRHLADRTSSSQHGAPSDPSSSLPPSFPTPKVSPSRRPSTANSSSIPRRPTWFSRSYASPSLHEHSS